jgi:hypothetical protein
MEHSKPYFACPFSLSDIELSYYGVSAFAFGFGSWAAGIVIINAWAEHRSVFDSELLSPPLYWLFQVMTAASGYKIYTSSYNYCLQHV